MDVIVNAWNRNFIPYKMLLTHGVSKAIKLKAGNKPFDEIQQMGLLSLGEAVLTGAGDLKCKGIIHVAGINMLWRSSYKATRLCAKSIIKIIDDNNFNSVAVPLIGCGANKLNEEKCIEVLIEEFKDISITKDIFIIRFCEN